MHPTVLGGGPALLFPPPPGSQHWILAMGGSFSLPTAVKTASPQSGAMGFTGWRAG